MRYTLISIALLLAGCAGTPRILAIHDPLYRASSHVSTITARATESRDGIAQIEIEAVVGELTACNSGFGLPSLIPCRSGAATTVATCSYANVKTEVSCSLPLNLGDRRIVTYKATARTASRSSTTVPTTYAGGAPLSQAQIRLPFFTTTIPWETARPILWRTNSPSPSANRDDKIDLGLLPDADMPSYQAFTDDLQPLVLALLYTDTHSYSAWTRTWKNVFNIWAGPSGADGEGCSRTFSGAAATVRSAFDGSAILHRNAFRDCASISLGGGAGTTQTNLSDAPWVLLHEAGHFMFGLGDEYDGGGNVSISTPKNVFGTKAECETASTANSLPVTQCVQIGSTGTWRNDDGLPTTMEDRTLNSDWRTLSSRALGNHLGRCFNTACY